mmetsp:Transcript_22353/g.88332  ORF Transcript_22353/g.88332 Transcript_22353/m.88332 type:complete len:473 (-) Transcript_22353:2942-4360(-)
MPTLTFVKFRAIGAGPGLAGGGPGSAQVAQRMLGRRPGADEEGGHLGRVDAGHRVGLPARLMVLVDGQRTDALDRLAARRAAQMEGVVDQLSLQPQLVGQAEAAPTAHELQRDRHHRRRALEQRRMGVARPVVVGLGQRVKDGGQVTLAEVAVDAFQRGLGRRHRREVGALHDAGDHMLGTGLGTVAQVLDQGRPVLAPHEDIAQAPFDRITGRDGLAGQREPFTHMARALGQEPAAAHVGEQADAGLGHRELGALAQHAQLGALADAHAAAHDDAVHQRHIGLGVGMDQVVEAVLLGEEVAQRRVARMRGLMEEADVAARTEGRRLALAAGAEHGHGLDLGTRGPVLEQRRQVTDHGQRQRIQRLRAVQRDEAQAAIDLGLDLAVGHEGREEIVHAFFRTDGTEGGARASWATSAASTRLPPIRAAWPGCSPANHQAQSTPNRVSAWPNRASSWLGSSRARRTASRQGRAS